MMLSISFSSLFLCLSLPLWGARGAAVQQSTSCTEPEGGEESVNICHKSGDVQEICECRNKQNEGLGRTLSGLAESYFHRFCHQSPRIVVAKKINTYYLNLEVKSNQCCRSKLNLKCKPTVMSPISCGLLFGILESDITDAAILDFFCSQKWLNLEERMELGGIWLDQTKNMRARRPNWNEYLIRGWEIIMIILKFQHLTSKEWLTVSCNHI